MSLAGQLPVTNFLNLLSALGTRMAPQYEPWAVALGALRRVRQLFAQAAEVKAGWQRCSGLLDRYVASHVTGQFVRGVQLAANSAPGLTFQVRAPPGVAGLDATSAAATVPVACCAGGWAAWAQARRGPCAAGGHQRAGRGAAAAPAGAGGGRHVWRRGRAPGRPEPLQ
jgi:hypothetical protein